MNRSRMPDREPMRRLGTVAVVLFCLGLLLTAASGAVAADVSISIQPSDGEVEEGEERTFQVVVEGADEGVGAHDLELTLGDGNVANITGVEFVNDPLPVQNQAEIRDGGTTVVAVAAMGNNAYEAGAEIAVLNVTVEGKALGESTELTVAGSSAVGDSGGSQYSVSGTTGATVSVVEEATGDGGGDSSDGSGPGFGVVGALVALAGAGYLLRRTASSG